MATWYFTGIGGAGMAPLAHIALELGCTVAGSDREANDKTAALALAGAVIHTGHRAEFLPQDCEKVIYSSAVPEDNPERAAARRRGIPQLRRGEFLAEIVRNYPMTVAVSGSHGKTSVTAMLVWILRKTGMRPGCLIGGSVPGLKSGEAGDGTVFVTEADESDGTHTLLFPSIGIIPNIEDDHAWSVGGKERLLQNFRTFASHCKTLITEETLRERTFPALPKHFAGFLETDAHFAIAAAEKLGVDAGFAAQALADYPGVARRMTVRYEDDALTIMEDYAHHPTEVAAAVDFLRKRYPGRHLRLLFQPHRYARLARYFEEFARVLERADSVRVVPVFAAWSETGVTDGKKLADAMGEKAQYLSGSWEETARESLPEERPAVLAVLGAGDIEKVFDFLPGKH